MSTAAPTSLARQIDSHPSTKPASFAKRSCPQATGYASGASLSSKLKGSESRSRDLSAAYCGLVDAQRLACREHLLRAGRLAVAGQSLIRRLAGSLSLSESCISALSCTAKWCPSWPSQASIGPLVRQFALASDDGQAPGTKQRAPSSKPSAWLPSVCFRFKSSLAWLANHNGRRAGELSETESVPN